MGPSKLWKHFRKLDNGKAACLHCSAQYRTENTRASMLYHIKHVHQTLWTSTSPVSGSTNENQQTSGNSQQSDSPRNQNLFVQASVDTSRRDQIRSESFCSKRKSGGNQKAEEITKRIAACIAMDMLPLSFIEGEGFKMLLNYLAPQYTMPSRTAIRTRLQDLYKATRRNIAENAQNYEAVALTTDAWTSRNTTSFVTVTLHSVSSDWQVMNHTLDSLNMTERHTADNLRDHLDRVIADWKLEEKVAAVAHDNASNISAAIRSSTLLGSSVRCFAHTLQLAINKSLEHGVIQMVLKNSSAIVSHFKHYGIATGALKMYQRQHKLPEHALIQRRSTRWNSSFSMAERLTEQREAVDAVLNDSKYTSRSAAERLVVSAQDWDLLKGIAEVLRPFEVATRVMSTETYPTLSVVRPLVRRLVDKFLKDAESDSRHLKEMKKIIRSELGTRFLETNIVTPASLAAILDPRQCT